MSSGFGYIRELDGLRGVSILLILGVHSGPLAGGSIGVDIFFVLSGYLITGILASEHDAAGQIHIGAFYLRRILRIVPAFAFMLLVYVVLLAVAVPAPRRHEQYWAVLYAASYVMNWTRAFGLDSGIIGHSWSLAVEEQFYLIWPLLLTGILGLRTRNRLLAVALLVLAAMLWRAWLASFPDASGRLFFGADTRANQLLLGCLLALAPMASIAGIAGRTWLAPAIALAVIAVIGTPLWLGCSDTFVIALCAGWLIAAVHSRRDTLLAMALRSQVLVCLGWLSYSLYLWHYPVLSALAGRGIVPANDVPLIGLPLSLAAAIFSYAVIERPFLRFKSQLSQPLGPAKLLAS